MDDCKHMGRVVPFARRWHVIQPVDLVRIIAAQDRRSALCDQLEACADALPVRPAAPRLDALRSALCALPDAPEYRLIDTLFAGYADSARDDVLLDHLRVRRTADAAHAQELLAALEPASGDHRPLSAEALGYLLRCCFAAMRQSIDFELLALLLLGEKRLTLAARDLLIARLGERLG